MKVYFPGSAVERQGQGAESFLFGIFAVTKGLMLAQVREITGLDTHMIQNWINRGWVKRPVDKRYSMDQLARIMIINMLRDVMRLEDISVLLTYINGSAQTEEDNIISDAKLYCYLCTVLDKIGFDTVLSEEELERAILTVAAEYQEPFPGAREKLVAGMKIILTYFAASLLKKRADQLYTKVLN